MNIKSQTVEDRLGKEYNEHTVFNSLNLYIGFYESLSFQIMNWITMGTHSITNIDTYTYSSIQGTLESIRMVLKKGRINDAYSLLRKFFDITIINIYSNLFLEDNYTMDSLIVEQIDDWIKGKKTIPEYRIMSQYIKKSERLKEITNLLGKDDRYKAIRNRCNDYTHYNFYHNLVANDNEIYSQNRIRRLQTLHYDLDHIFIQHLAYIFMLHQHYMSSSDYADSMDLGITPEEGSQYWVAPFIQEIFDEVINRKRPDIANMIKSETSMDLK